MPAGRKNLCEPCYWRELLEKRIRMDCAAFSSSTMASHFEKFGEWLGGHSGHKKASLAIHRHMLFFKDIESRWDSIPEYSSLLAAYEGAQLRRHFLPIIWMEKTGLIQKDPTLKATISETRRIQNVLGSLDEGKVKNVLLTYYDFLMTSYQQAQITLRTVRLALLPASRLLLEADKHHRNMPNQSDLFSYLLRAPGQRNSLSKFVYFLKNYFGVDLSLPPRTKKASRARREKSKLELIRLLTSGSGSLRYKKRLLGVALNYFHGLPIVVGQTRLHEVESDPSGGLTLQFKDNSYWLPEAISERLLASS
jgi:hypothetical protein